METTVYPLPTLTKVYARSTSSLAPWQKPLMTSFAVTKRPKNTRAKLPKVRTGCVTCKRRHLKCDEAKPGCKKCLKWIGTCGGYEVTKRRHSASSTPELSTGALSSSPSRSPDRTPEMETNSSISPGSWDDNAQSSPGLTEIFPSAPPWDKPLDAMDPNLRQPGVGSAVPDSGVFDAHFWRDIVPILVRENLAVRYSNLAVLVLIFAQSAIGVGGNYYGKALAHYGLALREVRESSTSDGGLQPAILCSMFFVIFEIMNGDVNAAEAHLYSGERMLGELRQSQPEYCHGAGSLRDELRCALQFLMLQADTPELTSERAGVLDAFVQMATSPNRIPNMTH